MPSKMILGKTYSIREGISEQKKKKKIKTFAQIASPEIFMLVSSKAQWKHGSLEDTTEMSSYIEDCSFGSARISLSLCCIS